MKYFSASLLINAWNNKFMVFDPLNDFIPLMHLQSNINTLITFHCYAVLPLMPKKIFINDFSMPLVSFLLFFPDYHAMYSNFEFHNPFSHIREKKMLFC